MIDTEPAIPIAADGEVAFRPSYWQPLTLPARKTQQFFDVGGRRYRRHPARHGHKWKERRNAFLAVRRQRRGKA